VRLVIARCSVDYVGRLSAHLPMATRLLIVKADGSVLVHSDGGSYKPLNWMSPPCRLEESPGSWRVVSKGGEELRITIEDVLHDSTHELGTDPGLTKDGVEAHLQELLAAPLHLDGVEQLTRYLELLNRDPALSPVRGVFAAQEIRPQARVLAEDRGIRCVTLDYNAMRGIELEGTLF